MEIDVYNVFSSSEYLKYAELGSLVSGVMKDPSMAKEEIASRFSLASVETSPKISRASYLVKRIWHNFLLILSSSYKRSFSKAAALIRLAVEEGEWKKKLASSVQAAFRARQKRHELAEAHKRLKHLKALSKVQLFYEICGTYKKVKKSAEAALYNKQKESAEVESALAGFIKLQEAESACDAARQKYRAHTISGGSRWKSVFTSQSDKSQDVKALAKKELERAEKELKLLKQLPVIAASSGSPEEEIGKLKKRKAELDSAIGRLARLKTVAELSLPVNSRPPAVLSRSPSPPGENKDSEKDQDRNGEEQKSVPAVLFSPIDREVSHNTSDLHSPKGRMLSSVAAIIHEDLKLVWEEMFKKCDPNNDKFVDWTCDEQGKFQIKLSRPIKLWVPSTNEQGEEDPIGGVVLMLGFPDEKIKGKLDGDSKTMHFEKGFHVHCHYKIPLPLVGELPINPHVFRLVYKNRSEVLFGAGLAIFGKKLFRDRVKSIDSLISNWGTNGEVVEGDHEAYIKRKKRERKQG